MKTETSGLQGIEKTITKALISEVLDIPVPDNIELIIGNKFNNNVKQTLLISYSDGSDSIEFNIYELVHECKEWALNNRYIIHTTPLLTEKKWRSNSVLLAHFYLSGEDRIIDEQYAGGRVDAKTEAEAVFKACNWILNRLKSKLK